MSTRLVSVVIPAFNERSSFPALLAGLVPVLEDEGVDFELIFVDDGSTDGSLDALRALHENDSRIKVVSFSRNFGKERAIAAGLNYARGAAVVIMDGDLQHPPETLHAFLARWREGYEVVYGERQNRSSDGAFRKWTASVFYRVFRILADTPVLGSDGDFRLLDRKAVDALNRLGERTRFNRGLYSWIGFRSVPVPYMASERAHGRSSWSWRSLLSFGLDGLISFSTVPLRLCSLIGIILSSAAFAYIIGFLVKTSIFGIDLPGFPTLIISIMLLSGVQLISLGVLGEYLGRVFEEVKGRPLYVVAEEIGLAPAAAPKRAEARNAKAPLSGKHE